MNRSSSSISDELKRNGTKKGYNPKWAQAWANERQHDAHFQRKKIASNSRLQEFIDKLLLEDQSPRAIAGRIKHHRTDLPRVSKDTICRYLNSPYASHIAYKIKRRRKRHRKPKPVTKPWKDRVFIDQRPKKINARLEVGHAEGDFVESGKSSQSKLLVIEDRKLRVVFLEQILEPSCDEIAWACLQIKKRYPEWKTMTTDNDLLFQRHKELEKMLGIKIYFCHPGHSWEKPQVENTNKYIRKDVPKSSDISKYSKQFIKKLELKLNNRIMKVIGYYMPREMLERYRKCKKRLRALKKLRKASVRI